MMGECNLFVAVRFFLLLLRAGRTLFLAAAGALLFRGFLALLGIAATAMRRLALRLRPDEIIEVKRLPDWGFDMVRPATTDDCAAGIFP
jgi:hypothetical protein